MLITVKCDKGDTHHFRGARYFKIESACLLVIDKDDSTMAAFAPGRWMHVVTVTED